MIGCAKEALEGLALAKIMVLDIWLELTHSSADCCFLDRTSTYREGTVVST